MRRRHCDDCDKVILCGSFLVWCDRQTLTTFPFHLHSYSNSYRTLTLFNNQLQDIPVPLSDLTGLTYVVAVAVAAVAVTIAVNVVVGVVVGVVGVVCSLPSVSLSRFFLCALFV